MTQTPDVWMLHTTNPREGESQWGGCYIVEADAHNDAATMRKVTGLDWEVVPMVRADSIGKCLHQIAEPATALEVERDAARYRWLREQHNNGDDSVTIFIGDEQHGPGHLDAQIDEAIAASQPNGEAA